MIMIIKYLVKYCTNCVLCNENSNHLLQSNVTKLLKRKILKTITLVTF